MERKSYHPTAPEIFIRQFLGDGVILKSLLHAQDTPLKRAQKAIHSLNDYEVTDLAAQLINGLGQEESKNRFWNVDRRDGALLLLKEVPLGVTDIEKVQEEYLGAVGKIDVDSDPFGSVDSLLEAGKVVSPFFVDTPHAKYQVKRAWRRVAKEVFKDSEEWKAVAPKTRVIEALHGTKLEGRSHFENWLRGGYEQVTPEIRLKGVEAMHNDYYSVHEIANFLNISEQRVFKDLKVLRMRNMSKNGEKGSSEHLA